MGTIWRNKGYSPAPFAENIFGGKPKGWHNLMSLTLVTHMYTVIVGMGGAFKTNKFSENQNAIFFKKPCLKVQNLK